MTTLDPHKLKAAIKYIDSWLDFNFQNSRLPGMQAAIRHGDKLLYSRAFGLADIAKNASMTTNHVLRIASHSKTFTATAIMQLSEAGKLQLDDAVSKHLEWFESFEDPRVQLVTIRQLLNHTAGVIRDGLDSNYWQLQRDFPEAEELKEYIKTSRLIYDSDEQFKYSNFGFSYLGLLIEAVSSKSYQDYTIENIIKRLELESTGPDLDSKAKSRLATGYGYELLRKERRALKHASTNGMAAATGFYANAEDVCTYFAAHFMGNNRLLSDSSKRVMQHGYWKVERDNEHYGLGMVNYKKKGWRLYGHSGGFPGFVTNTKFDAQKQLVVCTLTNSYDGAASSVNNSLLNIIDTFQQGSAEKKSITNYTGRFYSIWGPTDIVAVGNKLYALNPLNWGEFNNPDQIEELSVANANTLNIDKASGYSSPGETIVYDFGPNQVIKGITYGGSNMLPWDEALKQGLV